jgi:hypothetical protein
MVPLVLPVLVLSSLLVPAKRGIKDNIVKPILMNVPLPPSADHNLLCALMALVLMVSTVILVSVMPAILVLTVRSILMNVPLTHVLTVRVLISLMLIPAIVKLDTPGSIVK